MSDGENQLPTREEQWERYRKAKARWDADYAAWNDGGRVGPPPPYPVRPHTPGWR